MADVEDWRIIAARAHQRVLDSIPAKWRLSVEAKAQYTGNAIHFITRCGILTESQIAITEHTASELLRKIHSGQLTVVEVTEAYCTRAAIAHQLVNCFTDFFPDEALEYAKTLDDEFSRTGKPIGPLHGMPMAVKDM
jgi:amidase